MKAFIIQARVGSTRLPNKILLPFYNQQTIIDLLLEKLKIFNLPIVIATSTNAANDVLEEVAQRHNVKCFRGDEDNVLQRFISAAESFGFDELIRVCSDNPMLDASAIQHLITVSDSRYDYISFDVNGCPSIKTHFGFWTEYVTLNALRKVTNLTGEKLYHEHVTNYIYAHPNDFNIKWINVDKSIACRTDLRTTIDTNEDFCAIQTMYSELVNSGTTSISDIIAYADAHHQLLDQMKNQIIRNSK